MAKNEKEKESPVQKEDDSLDYSGVDQGTEEQPALQEISTAEVKGKGKKTKGKGKKGGKAPASGLNKYRDQIRCGFCNNSMTQSKNINVFEVKGKKIPKGADGKPTFESPGVAKGKIGGVLCDDCVRVSQTTGKRADGSSAVDIKFAVACREDGSVQMVRVGELQNTS